MSVIAPTTVGQTLDDRAAGQGDAPYLVDAQSGAAISFSMARGRAAQLAAALAGLGIQPGDSVAYALHNGVDAAIAVLGIMYGGYRAVAVNLVAGADAMGYAIAHSQSQIVLTTDRTRTAVADAMATQLFLETAKGAPPPAVVDLADLKPSGTGSEPAAVSIGPDSDALIMYTSGTTGRPKGVVLSHASVLAGGENVTAAHQLSSSDRVLCVLPLFHINGLCVTLLGPLVSGSSVVFPQRFSASRFWGWVAEHRCTWLSVVPTQISYLLHGETDPPAGHRVRFARSASAPLAAEAMLDFESRFGIPMVETMGLTETAAQVFSNPMPPGERRAGSPGHPVGTQLRIVDGSLNDCATDVEGEILLRGPNVMSRYFRNEEATGSTFVEGGWLRTGDLGRVDADGWIFITGRLKELIIKGGENIAPREIDEALLAHPDVIESAAFGRPCPNYGERVEAAVAVTPGVIVEEAALLELCAARLGTFKCPDRVHQLPELPKGPSGKIQRRLVAELCP